MAVGFELAVGFECYSWVWRKRSRTWVSSGKREDSGVEWKARGKQGFSGSGAPQSRVFSAKKPQNRVPSTAKYLNQDVTDGVIVRVLVLVSVRDFGST